MLLLALKIGSVLYVANHIPNSLYPQESECAEGSSCKKCKTTEEGILDTIEPTKQPTEQKGVLYGL